MVTDRNDKPERGASRRAYLRMMALAGIGAALSGCGGSRATEPAATTAAPVLPAAGESTTRTAPAQPARTSEPASTETLLPSATSQPTAAALASGQAYLAAARGEDPAAITRAAIEALGGMGRFVKAGFDVIIKPNICTDYYSFEYGATTNPEVVAELVRLALGAGAERVRVMDQPFGGSAESAYVTSGIGEAVKAAGGEMELMNRNKFKKTPIPEGVAIKEWVIYQEALACDLLIDVGTAKHHSLTRMTAAEKNLMGVIGSRGGIHSKMADALPDLVTVLKPALTVVDAVRTLMANGPTGGNLDDVKKNNLVIASHDIVAADAYAATLFNLSSADIPYIKRAAERGLGTADLSSVNVAEIHV